MQADSDINGVHNEPVGSPDSEVSKGGKRTVPRYGPPCPERCLSPESLRLLRRLGLSFFLFGLINNGELNMLLLWDGTLM